jgi:hypothetical protein
MDFDAAHENTYDFLHGYGIETIEAVGDLGREVLETADRERKVTRGVNDVKRGPMPLLEFGKDRDALLELRLVDESLRIAVDQATDAAPPHRYLLIETSDPNCRPSRPDESAASGAHLAAFAGQDLQRE